MTSPAVYSFNHLVDAWQDARRWKSAHPDIAEHHAAAYAAFSAGFGVDLDHAPKVAPPMPDWVVDQVLAFQGGDRLEDEGRRWHVAIHRLALDIEGQIRSLHGPFSDYLEAPISVIAARHRYAAGIDARVRALRSSLQAMLLELLETLHPEAAPRHVGEEDLRKRGFDPGRPAPDPLDYW